MPEAQLVDFGEATLVTAQATCPQTELGPTIAGLYGQIAQACEGLDMAGPPRLYYLEWLPERCTVEAALVVVPPSVVPEGVSVKTSPAGTALTATHMGPYEGLAGAWAELWKQVAELGLKPGGSCWDEYVTDPGAEPDPDKWQTDLYVQVDVPKI